MVGGSLGARTINRSIQGDLDKFFASDVQVIWQTGRYYYSDASKHLKAYRDIIAAGDEKALEEKLTYSSDRKRKMDLPGPDLLS